MALLTVGYENAAPIELYYEDWGCGSPVVLVHGYPVSSQSWERQASALLQEGHRVITYDRRGGARSSQPSIGYDWDTLAGDLNTLLTTLDIRHAVLVGHSVGTGDVMRYLRVHGSKRISRAALLAPVNPQPPMHDAMRTSVSANSTCPIDRYALLSQVIADYYNVDAFLGTRVSPEVIARTWDLCAASSAMLGTMLNVARETDFRLDAEAIDVPVLVVLAGSDRILPAARSEAFDMLPRSRRVVVPRAPHGLLWTHALEVNDALLDFIDA